MELNLNEHHRNEVFNYLRFWRYQRMRRLRSVLACFDDIKQSRLRGETTFTIDEMIHILDELHSLVRAEMEGELIGTGHTNVLMLRQVFSQAEKWHLKLSTNISELENRELLDQIRDFEEVEFAGVKIDKDFATLVKTTTGRLVPVNETGGTALLHAKIEELERDNKQLTTTIKSLNEQTKGLSKEQERLKNRSGSDKVDMGKQEQAMSQMQQQMENLLRDLESSKGDKDRTTAELTNNLASTKHELLRVQDMLSMTERELEKKVQDTAPFRNMKQMLVKKNDQIKELRHRLNRYEPESS